ncbi:alpha-N-acetylglucosaminidase [Mucilaginibacter terrigena]|nr:alpha-N-acetylglucosaminidase [Mucilaginibacter terrigena]
MWRFKIKAGFLSLMLSCALVTAFAADTLNKNACYALINRITPKHAARFEVAFIPKDGAKDVFELESAGQKIVLRGNNETSVASALNYYLKNYAHYDIGWNTAEVHDIPDVLPLVPNIIRKATPYKYRYNFNYCTFNYTASWWDWDRWQRAIDWMAMNGINMPLALTGQNSVWYNVYKGLGFTDRELEGFFTGPAYFNWFWMGNLDGWGGPLSQSFMKKHEALQKQILARERELGMTPILPAFTGHVPRSFKDHYPNAKLFKTTWGDDFPSVAFSSMLDPNDPTFTVIGKKFMEEQNRIYGTNHFYSADTFNEMMPPSNDSTFLDQVGKKIYQSMASNDTAATWVMQGWMFSYSPDFWKPTQMKGLLNSVPADKLIVLDLWGEIIPQWKENEAFYGKQWIWCMLHNFGGTNSLYGDMAHIANDPNLALHDPGSGRMQGIGLTMEAIDQNPAIYALMLDNIWEDKPIDLDNWVKEYAHRRYGQNNADAESAWSVLKNTVYSGQPWWGTASIITGRPTFEKEAKWTHTELHYKPANLLPAWEKLLAASSQLKNNDGFQYDLVDISRQVMANYANHVQQQFAASYRRGDMASYKKQTALFLTLIDDMDKLLATRKDFLLGKWLNDAKSYGDDQDEKQLFEKNARDLVSLWGDKDCGIHDYAYKQWAGMLKGYYKHRWIQFFSYVDKQTSLHKKIDQKQFEENIKNWEWSWVNSHEDYSSTAVGDSVKTAGEMYVKYGMMIKTAYAARAKSTSKSLKKIRKNKVN